MAGQSDKRLNIGDPTNAYGTPDTAFYTSVGSQEIFGPFHGRVIHIGVQPDGRIILFGDSIQLTQATRGKGVRPLIK